MNDPLNPYFVILFIYIFLVGLCVGSFLNVVILRGLSGEGIVFERSKCPKCNNKLKWFMNIPLVSYIFLRGKCAFCKEHISIQYPLIEALCAVLFCYAFWVFGFNFNLLFKLAAICLFIVMSATDIKKTVIVDVHAYILAGLGIIYSLFDFSSLTISQSLIGAVSGFLFFEILSFISKKIINYRMFGEGDSLIALGLGAFFGFKTLLIIIPLSFLIQFVFAIPFLIIDSFKKGAKKLGFSYVLISAGVLILFAANYIKLPDNNYSLYTTITIITSLFMLLALRVLFCDIKEKTLKNNNENIIDETQTSFFSLPFGPALLIAAGLCLFYIDFIKDAVKNFFSI